MCQKENQDENDVIEISTEQTKLKYILNQQYYQTE